MKKCNTCLKTKNIDSFYKHNRYEDNRFKKCKDCCNKSKRDKNKQYLSKEKYIYIIKNNAWENYLKIGSTINIKERLKSYQTGSTLRDYRVVFLIKTNYIYLIENYFKNNFSCSHEWVLMTEKEATNIILKLINEEKSKGR